MTIVESDIVGKAYDNFMNLFYPGKQGGGFHLWVFLGLENPPNLTTNKGTSWEFPDEKSARLVTMLAGPHYETVAKAMIINGHQHASIKDMAGSGIMW